MKVLFIGNSHTYYNDMPEIFAEMCRQKGIDCHVAMLAHGGWKLSQHVQEPDVRFNILYGNYDYVIMQDHAHPFLGKEELCPAVKKLNEWIKDSGAVPVLYMTWEQKENGEQQPVMSAAYRETARETGSLLAPVGDIWWEKLRENPDLPLFGPDGQHATEKGSRLAAEILLQTILDGQEKSRQFET